MIFDTGQWRALAAIRELANLVEPDTGQDERVISTFAFDLTLIQVPCLNDQLKERFGFLMRALFHGELSSSVCSSERMSVIMRLDFQFW